MHEQQLVGKTPSPAVIQVVAALAAQAAQPSADRRGTVEYKREMARVLAGRALRIAVARAGGH